MEKSMKVLFAALALVVMPVMATNLVESPEVRIKKRIETQFPDFKVDIVRPSPVRNIYEVAMGDEVVYVSADGNHLIFGGTLLDIAKEKPVNLTQNTKQELDALRAPMRKAALDKVNESSMVTFKAPNQKYEISVFTDIDCGYCRKLHSEISQINALGITVHYLAFPRAGLDSPSYDKLVNVWCADDPKKAMTAAKSQQIIANKNCKNPIRDHFELVRDFGLNGTPAIILPDGTLLPGYMPPERLLEQIKQHMG